MKKITTLLLVVVSIVALAGCGSLSKVRVPSNSISFESPYGKLTLSHPQNTDMTNVMVEIQTNGAVHAEIGSLHTVNDPQVIKTTADGQAQIVKENGIAIVNGINAAANFSGAAAKKVIVPTP